jgi:hypothetical protein
MWWSFFHRVWRVGVAVAMLAGPIVRAQNDAASQRAAIDGMYPIMLGALQAKNFGRARNICDQAIVWEPQNPVHHYNLACIEAQAGGPRLPYAWGALELAIALGFNDAEHLQTDPDLIPLRTDPRFADLVRKIIYNRTAGSAVASINLPPSRITPPAAQSDELPTAAAFRDGVPTGMFLMRRYLSSTQTFELGAWYFAPDGIVYRDLKVGFSSADLASHPGPRGKAARVERSLAIDWADGTKSIATLELDRGGFTWDMGIFSPVTPFESASDVPGAYEGVDSVTPGVSTLPVHQRLELRPDGSFSWEGVAFERSDSGGRLSASTQVAKGRWQLSGWSLILEDSTGVSVRRLAIPEDDEKTVVKPDRMFFGGLVYKRRP